MRKKQFPLRLDPDLYDALARWAADELRSVNAHIEFLLKEAVKRAGREPKKAVRKKETMHTGEQDADG
ncbi:MAG: toxin-antitoxin system HicB family antitoxin [Candidatus Carbobacillus altaicus]|uniref:Uncharacterized protein n=1 Tax=Candidatus Carbonibacillus altaicus TaxID=2163959 RepID=A0A2R6Y3I0_9BACL|nr:toxin-antitoxin system HicB family antitoxin [Candidatus Carbobacillus altaicus]PTQ57244.1 MAG: hypothetical protein BSOLF_2009 [Candidatus Carbobacillus altaicus]